MLLQDLGIYDTVDFIENGECFTVNIKTPVNADKQFTRRELALALVELVKWYIESSVEILLEWDEE